MTRQQHEFFDLLVQQTCATRADLHQTAWSILGVLLLGSLLVLVTLGIWILFGGLSRYLHLSSAAGRGAADQWLEEK